MPARIRLNPLVMGLCFYHYWNERMRKDASLNPLVMGLCFYHKENSKKSLFHPS